MSDANSAMFTFALGPELRKRAEGATLRFELTANGRGNADRLPLSRLYHAGAELLCEEIRRGRVKAVAPNLRMERTNAFRFEFATRRALEEASRLLDAPASVGAMLAAGVALFVAAVEAGESLVHLPSLERDGARQDAGDSGEYLADTCPAVVYGKLRKAPRPLTREEALMFDAEAKRLRNGVECSFRGLLFTEPGDPGRKPSGPWTVIGRSGLWCIVAKSEDLRSGLVTRATGREAHVYDLEAVR